MGNLPASRSTSIGVGLLVSAVVAVAMLPLVFARAAEPDKTAPPKYLSPIAMVADKAGKTIYIAEATAGQVAVFDVATRKVTANIDIGLPVSGVTISSDGTTLYVTAGGAEGKLCVIDIKSQKVTTRIPVGHTPISPVAGPDGKTVYVCNQFNNAIGVVDVASGKQTASIPVPRQPVNADISKDGRTLIVANHLPAGAFISNRTSAEISIIDTASEKIVSSLKLFDGSTNLRRVRISPDGKYAAVTHRIGRYHLPRTQLERGWANTNMVALIDVGKKAMVNSIALDDIDHGAANPWAIAWSPDSKTLCITHSSNHEISVINFPTLLARLARSVTEKKDREVANDLSYLWKLRRRRVKLAGNGPRSMVIIGAKAYIGEYFSDSLSVVGLARGEMAKVEAIALGPKLEMTAARRGEMFFNDAQLCFQRWLSCSSCHPGGRTDGLNWDLMHDGMGNPKSGKSLVWSHKTPPSMMLTHTPRSYPAGLSIGGNTDAKATVRWKIRHVQFAARPEKTAMAIYDYLKSIEPAPSPLLVNGKLSPAALQGEKLFKTAKCASCHSGEIFTDQKKHDIGTRRYEPNKKAMYDTPTLIEIWRTAPYLCNGQAATILEMLAPKHNPKDQHGKTSNLTKQQLSDLAEYVLSL